MTYSNFTTFTSAGAFAQAAFKATTSDKARKACTRERRSFADIGLVDTMKQIFALTKGHAVGKS